MIKIIRYSHKNYLRKYYNNLNKNLYFVYYVDKVGLKVPHLDKAMKFLVEYIYDNPMCSNQGSL